VLATFVSCCFLFALFSHATACGTDSNCRYEGGFDASSPVVQSFWKFVFDASPETQIKLLKFATGSPKAPIGGLVRLLHVSSSKDTERRKLADGTMNLYHDHLTNYYSFASRQGKMPFKIQRAGPDSMQLPTAHTCFNTLILRMCLSGLHS
jgi:ubiquitin-protein ligase E3 A